MSVIVSEMPDNCLECPLSYLDYYFTDLPLRCPLMSDRIEVDKIKRHKDCPLKSVDRLIEEIQRMPNDNTSYWYTCDVLNRDSVIDTVKEYCGMEEK